MMRRTFVYSLLFSGAVLSFSPVWADEGDDAVTSDDSTTASTSTGSTETGCPAGTSVMDGGDCIVL